ncbi:MAG: hypothetical protein KUA37_16045 [Desulfomicrobium sp.]|nr:hypothetical protein [Pseudomonadota bacterium]MBV1713494.1 hypothetical protein [Desulfomicrobium sp.]MBU4572030.1 hypothetical protein [Pseudomonadota bacterium]MBU4594008.1 hypothetical protein [Pseudomonadota bacterium]MBV1721041.1 hypothetical protein [Desulfomicrobium sp.]
MISPKRTPLQGRVHAVLVFLCCAVFTAAIPVRSANAPETATTSAPATVSQDADAALRGLAEKNALTVRALIGYGRMPASAMAPLSGLRGKGIDVLGASPEQLDALIAEQGDTLSAAEKQALTQVSQIMHEASNAVSTPDQAAASNTGGTTDNTTPATDDSAPGAQDTQATSEPTQADAAASFVPSRPAPAPLPPMPLPPALPMVELGGAQYAGMITTAKEATRTLMGEMGEADAQRFENRWAAYYDFPSAEISDHFRALTPLMSEFLNIREAIATTSAAFDDAWGEAMLAAEYGSAEGADAALAQADMLKDYLSSLEARGNQLAQGIKALGEAPSPVAAKEEAKARHKSAIETIAGLFVEAPAQEGVWYGSSEYGEEGWIKGIKGAPILLVVYAVGDPANPRYRALYLDAADYDEKEDPHINVFGMNDGDTPDMPGMGHAFGESTLRHTYELKDEDDTYVITIAAERLAEGIDSFDYPPPVALDTVEAAYEKMRSKQVEDRAQFEATETGPAATPEEALKQGAERIGTHVALSLFEKAALSELHDARRHNEWTPTFVRTARQWLKERSFSEKTTLAQDRKALSAMFANLLGPQTPSQEEPAMIAKAPEQVEEPAADDAGEEAALEEAERTAKIERIEFHNQNMIIIQRNLDRDREDLAKETDPDRRAQLEFRVITALSDLQSEKDLVASIQTGELVRTRTPFDDYAHAGFIANIQQSQRQMERFQRSSDALFKLAGMLPGSEGSEARAFVERQLTPEARLNMDQAAVKRIAEALGKKVEGHYLGEQAKSDEDAAYATLGLEAAENIKSAADSSMMVLSLFGGQYVDAAYQAATGYVEGGMEEAVLRTASMFGPTAGAAAEAMRGYREGGVEGALKGGVISFVTSKGLEYGMGKVLGKAKNVDGPDAPASKKGAGSPDAPAAKPAPAGQQQGLAKIPPASDQRALEQFNKARKQGENLAEDFRQAQKRLADAGSAGAPAEEIMRLQSEVREKVAQVNGSPHAKNFLKYKGDAGSQRAYNAHLRSVHADVEAKFHANMQANGWNQPPLKEFRNAASSGSVGMDFDIGLDAQMARSIARDGKPGKINEWQQDAQKAWNEAYKTSTGLDAEQAWETITTHAHPESYKDMAWLAKNKSGVSKAWGQQAADVTRYKSWHMMNDASLDKMTKLQEISRGAAKDMQTKLGPILDQVKPTGKSLSAFNKSREHWNKVRQILTDFGENNIDPITADRRIRELTGGKSIPDVVEDMTYLLEGAVKFGKRS